MANAADQPAPLRAALEGLLRNKKPGDEVTVERLERTLKPAPRNEIVWVLKDLDAAGWGRFISGRRGQPSRFYIGDTTKAAVSPPPAQANVSAQELATTLQHVFVFRTSPPLALTLPLDLTRVEAERIMKWVQTLPVDDLI